MYGHRSNHRSSYKAAERYGVADTTSDNGNPSIQDGTLRSASVEGVSEIASSSSQQEYRRELNVDTATHSEPLADQNGLLGLSTSLFTDPPQRNDADEVVMIDSPQLMTYDDGQDSVSLPDHVDTIPVLSPAQSAPALENLFSSDEPPIAYTSNDHSQHSPSQSINDIPTLSIAAPDPSSASALSTSIGPTSTPSTSIQPGNSSALPTIDEDASVQLAQILANESTTRKMRKRTIAQLYPYSTEMVHYKTLVRNGGYRPTRLIDLNDDTQIDPTVEYEERPPHSSDRAAHKAHPAHRSLSDSHDKHAQSKHGRSDLQSAYLTQQPASRRIIRDSEDEASDLENTKTPSRHQQFYFSDTEDETSQNQTGQTDLRVIEDWDPFNSDGDSDSDISLPQARTKGALPASFIPEHGSSHIASITPRKGVAINKKGHEKHSVRREIPSHRESSVNARQTEATDGDIFDLDQVEITEVRESEQSRVEHGSSWQRSSFPAQSGRQTDIRDYGNDFNGAEEHDVVDHMVSRTSRPRGEAKKPKTKRRNGASRAVAVSRNPRTSGHSSRGSKKTKKKPTFQSIPSKRFHGAIIQDFVNSFQNLSTGPRAFPSTISASDPKPANDGVANPKQTKRRGPKTLAIVSGLHTPRNKPKVHSHIFQVETGSYVPRVLPKRPRRPQAPAAPIEFPAAAFDTFPAVPQVVPPEIPALMQHDLLSRDMPAALYARHPLDESAIEPTHIIPTDCETAQRSENFSPADHSRIAQTHFEQQFRNIDQPQRSGDYFRSSLLSIVPQKYHDDKPSIRSSSINLSMITQESYSFNFNFFPFPSSVRFEDDSFVGSGIFEKIVVTFGQRKPISGPLSGYFGAEIGKLVWGELNSEVISSFRASCGHVVRWITEFQDSITSEHTESSYHFWKFSSEYFAHKLDLGPVEDVEQVLEIIGKSLSAIMDCLNISTSKHSKWKELSLTSVMALLTLLFAALRFYLYLDRPSNWVKLFSDASTFLVKRLLSSFNEISLNVRSQRHANSVITRNTYLIEISYICVHLSDAGAVLWELPSFLDIVKTCVKTSMDGQSEIAQNEALWQSLFMFNTFYHMHEPPRIPHSSWSFVNDMVTPVLDSLKANPDQISPSKANYAKALLARCLILISTWDWQPDRVVIMTAYSYFARVRYTNMEPKDVGHQLPVFLMNTSLYSSYTYPAIEDTIFHVFLKLLAMCMKAYKRDNPRQLHRLVDSVNVLNNFTYPPRDAEIQVADLESLANQYSLLLTRYKFSSKSTQPPLEQLVGLFTLENSHLLARELTVDAWKVVVEIQLNRNQSLTPAMHWYDQLLGKAFDEYLQLDKATGPAIIHLENREIRRRKDHLEIYEKFLFKPLQYINKFLENKIALVKNIHWESLLRRLFMRILSSEVREELRFAILDVIRNFIGSALYMQAAEPILETTADEDSQTVDFVLPLQNFERREFVVRLARYFVSTIPMHSYKEVLNELLLDTNANSDSFIRKAIDVWAETAKFLVATKEQDWQVFYYSWQWFRKSARRVTYESYWLAALLKVSGGAYYYDEETKILQDLMKYLVCVYPVYEQKYVAAVIEQEPAIFSNCLQEIKNLTTRDFAQNRLAILHGMAIFSLNNLSY